MEHSIQSKCFKCAKFVSVNDAFSFDGDHIVHLDCGRPRTVSSEERALLFRYCFDHAVAECAACAQSFRQLELGSDLVSNRVFLCPNCRQDVTDSVRGHLYSCAMLPEQLRRTLHAAREAVGKLIRRSASHRADVLKREAEAAIAELRETIRRTVTE